MLTIYISNLSEDVWPFICSFSNEDLRQAEIEDNINTCDRDLFALSHFNDLLCILPKPVSRSFLAYYQQVCGRRQVECFHPKAHSGSICDDIRLDQELFRNLVGTARSVGRVRLISYCYSRQFKELALALAEAGVDYVTPEAPLPGSEWVVDFYGSKSGIRQLVSKAQGAGFNIKMPEGYVFSDIQAACAYGAQRYVQKGGLAIKTNRGHAGAGVLIFRPGDLPAEVERARQALLQYLSREKYWQMFPIVVEDYVDLDPSIAGGSPSIEYCVVETGEPCCLYPCAMRVSPEGVFQGVEINYQALPEGVTRAMEEAGTFISREYARAGYRGYFDIDFMAAKDGTLYVGESNVRRTGGTHAYYLARHLVGSDFLRSSYVIANNCFPLPVQAGPTPGFEELLELLSPLAFRAETKEGLILTSEHKLSQKQIAFVIIAPTRGRAFDIEHNMLVLLGK